MGATSIQLMLDEQTFRRWSMALSNLSLQRQVPLHPVGSFPLASALPTTLQFTGLQLLLAIGRACTRPEVSDDPSRFFGILKYATSVSANTSQPVPGYSGVTDLSLVSGIATLDSHKKAVLSDEFGCGMSFLFSGQVFGTIFYLDVETALRLEMLTTTSPRSRRPDYIACGRSRSCPWVILEAKATQTGDTYCRDTQVPNGCEQLSKVQLVGSGTGNAIRVVVGTSLYREGQRNTSKVYIGDPEPEDPDQYRLGENAIEAVVRSHYLRIATLTGDLSLGSHLVGGDRGGGDATYLQPREIGGRLFAGSNVYFHTPGSSVDSFVGLDTSIRDQLLSSNYMEVFDKWRLPEAGAVQLSGSEGQEPYTSFEHANDGAMLMLKFDGRITGELQQ